MSSRNADPIRAMSSGGFALLAIAAISSSLAAEEFKLEPAADYKIVREGRPAFPALSPDGKYLAIQRATPLTSFEVIEPLSGKTIETIAAGGLVQWLQFSGDGLTLAVSTCSATDRNQDLKTTFLDVGKWKPRSVLPHEVQHEGLGLALSPNGRLLAWCQAMRAAPGKVTVWDGATRQVLAEFGEIRDYRPQGCFSGDNKWFAVINDPPAILDLAKKTRTQLPKPPSPSVTAIALSADGTRVVYGHVSGGLSLVDVGDNKIVWTKEQLGPSRRSTSAVALSADGRFVFATSGDSGIWVLGAKDGNKLGLASGAEISGSSYLQPSSDGKLLHSRALFPDRAMIWRLTPP